MSKDIVPSDHSSTEPTKSNSVPVDKFDATTKSSSPKLPNHPRHVTPTSLSSMTPTPTHFETPYPTTPESQIAHRRRLAYVDVQGARLTEILRREAAARYETLSAEQKQIADYLRSKKDQNMRAKSLRKSKRSYKWFETERVEKEDPKAEFVRFGFDIAFPLAVGPFLGKGEFDHPKPGSVEECKLALIDLVLSKQLGDISTIGELVYQCRVLSKALALNEVQWRVADMDIDPTLANLPLSEYPQPHTPKEQEVFDAVRAAEQSLRLFLGGLESKVGQFHLTPSIAPPEFLTTDQGAQKRSFYYLLSHLRAVVVTKEESEAFHAQIQAMRESSVSRLSLLQAQTERVPHGEDVGDMELAMLRSEAPSVTVEDVNHTKLRLDLSKREGPLTLWWRAHPHPRLRNRVITEDYQAFFHAAGVPISQNEDRFDPGEFLMPEAGTHAEAIPDALTDHMAAADRASTFQIDRVPLLTYAYLHSVPLSNMQGFPTNSEVCNWLSLDGNIQRCFSTIESSYEPHLRSPKPGSKNEKQAKIRLDISEPEKAVYLTIQLKAMFEEIERTFQHKLESYILDRMTREELQVYINSDPGCRLRKLMDPQFNLDLIEHSTSTTELFYSMLELHDLATVQQSVGANDHIETYFSEDAPGALQALELAKRLGIEDASKQMEFCQVLFDFVKTQPYFHISAYVPVDELPKLVTQALNNGKISQEIAEILLLPPDQTIAQEWYDVVVDGRIKRVRLALAHGEADVYESYSSGAAYLGSPPVAMQSLLRESQKALFYDVRDSGNISTQDAYHWIARPYLGYLATRILASDKDKDITLLLSPQDMIMYGTLDRTDMQIRVSARQKAFLDLKQVLHSLDAAQQSNLDWNAIGSSLKAAADILSEFEKTIQDPTEIYAKPREGVKQLAEAPNGEYVTFASQSETAPKEVFDATAQPVGKELLDSMIQFEEAGKERFESFLLTCTDDELKRLIPTLNAVLIMNGPKNLKERLTFLFGEEARKRKHFKTMMKMVANEMKKRR